MSRFTKTLLWIQEKPEYIIQVILATVLIATGSYFASPWYVSSATTTVGIVFDTIAPRVILGVAYVASGLVSLHGVMKGSTKIRYWGTFMVFLAYCFMMILRLFAFGFTPVFWLIILGMALIAGVMYLIEGRKIEVGG